MQKEGAIMLKKHLKAFSALAMALVLLLGTLSACTITWESGKAGDTTAADFSAARDAGSDDLKDLIIDTSVDLNDADTAVTGNGAAFANGVLTITKAGTYALKGTLSNGQIVIDTEDEAKVRLLLDGVKLHSDRSAPLLVLSSPKETKLLLAEDSENTLSDAAGRTAQEEDAPDAVIYSKDDLEISGTGTLNIEANDARGIVSNDTLQISGGTLNVTSADDALRGKEGVDISGGVVNLRSGGDGVQASDEEKGSLSVSGGVLTLNTGKDGLQAEADLTVSGGVLEIVSGGSAIKGAADVKISGGDLSVDAANDGIHADKTLTVTGGSVEIRQAEEGLEGTSVSVTGGSVDITASDDGINAAAPGSSDNDFAPGGGNGSARRPEDGNFSLPGDDSFVRPPEEDGRPEPPDGDRFTLPEDRYDGYGEKTFDTALASPENESGSAGVCVLPLAAEFGERPEPPTDENGRSQRPDGANGPGGNPGAGFGYDASSVIKITGGSVTVNSGGDGLDSNGDIKMTGGSVTVFGPTNSGNSALDYGGSFEMTGGTLLAVGAAGMAQSVSSGCAAIAANCEIAEGCKVEIQTASGKTLTSFTAPKRIGHLVYADGSVKAGESYRIVVNGNTAASAAAK